MGGKGKAGGGKAGAGAPAKGDYMAGWRAGLAKAETVEDIAAFRGAVTGRNMLGPGQRSELLAEAEQKMTPLYSGPAPKPKESEVQHWIDSGNSRPVAQSLAVLDMLGLIASVEGHSKSGGIIPFSVRLINGSYHGRSKDLKALADAELRKFRG